jgi:hypothetical protein
MTRYILLKDGSVVEIDSCSGCPLYDKPYCPLLDTSPNCDRKTETPDDCPLPTSRADSDDEDGWAVEDPYCPVGED